MAEHLYSPFSMAELVKWINGEGECLCSGRDNLETVATYLAALQSDSAGRPVTVEEVKAQR